MGFGRRAVVATVGVLGLMLMGAWCWPAAVGVVPGRTALDLASQLVLEGGDSRGDEAMPAVAEPSAASAAATPEAVLRAWFGSDAPLRVKAFKLVERDGTDREVYRVVISAEPDAPLPYGWNPGDNIRWVMLQKAPSGWVMAEVASTPLSSSRPGRLADEDRSRTAAAIPADAARAPDGQVVAPDDAVRGVDSSVGQDPPPAPGATTHARTDRTLADRRLGAPPLGGEHVGLAAPGGEWEAAISGADG